MVWYYNFSFTEMFPMILLNVFNWIVSKVNRMHMTHKELLQEYNKSSSKSFKKSDIQRVSFQCYTCVLILYPSLSF